MAREFARLFVRTLLGAIVFGAIAAGIVLALVLGLKADGKDDLLARLENQARSAVEEVAPDTAVYTFAATLKGRDSGYFSASDTATLPYPAFHTIEPYYWADHFRWFAPLELVAAFADTVCYIARKFSLFGAIFAIGCIVVGVLATVLILAILAILARPICPTCHMHSYARFSLLLIGGIVFGSMTAGVVDWLMIKGDLIQPGFPIPFTSLVFAGWGLTTAIPIGFHACEGLRSIERKTA